MTSVAVLNGLALVIIAALAVVVFIEMRRPQPTSPAVLDRLEDLERFADSPPPEPDAWLDRLHRPRLLLHLTDDSTVSGTLLTAATDGVVLVGAELIDAGTNGDNVGLGGELFVPRARIAFVQRERTEP